MDSSSVHRDRPASLESESAETRSLQQRKDIDRSVDEEDSRLQDDSDQGRLESDTLLVSENEKAEPAKPSFHSSMAWMTINTLATIGIVGPPPF